MARGVKQTTIQQIIEGRPTYLIAPDGKSIKCLRCGLTSHNQNDVKYLYCGNCHGFHVKVETAGTIKPGAV